MDTATITYNASDLDREMAWLAEVIDMRIRLKTGQKSRYRNATKIKPPSLRRSKSEYGRFVLEHGLEAPERFLLILAIAPHIRPDVLDAYFGWMRQETYTGHDDAKPEKTADPAASGKPLTVPAAARHHQGFLPTGETAVFLFADDDVEKRLQLLKAFERSHPFTRQKVLRLEEPPPGQPTLSGQLLISEAALRLFTTGEILPPGFDPDFPATRMHSEMQWEDLVLAGQVQPSLGRIEAFLRNRDSLTSQWRQEKHHTAGLAVLFFGPSGTGKALAATLLGKKTGVDVYRVDLSAVVSKYIGETEKNLSRIFEKAEAREWILFFDEADALFGKRTAASDAHDRYSNQYSDTASAQAASLLLSFMENFAGLAILSMDLHDKPADRLLRHFEQAVHFSMPGEEERLLLWKEGFGKGVRLDRSVDLKYLAATYELSGGTIMKVIRFANLNALRRNSRKVALDDILEGIVHHKPG